MQHFKITINCHSRPLFVGAAAALTFTLVFAVHLHSTPGIILKEAHLGTKQENVDRVRAWDRER